MNDDFGLCPACGSPILPDFRFCPQCGAQLREVPENMEEAIEEGFTELSRMSYADLGRRIDELRAKAEAIENELESIILKNKA